jgi:hypothetical protein
MSLERFAPASRTSHPPTSRRRGRLLVTQFVTPTANRPLPQARGFGHRLDPAVPQFERFTGRPTAASALIEFRLKTGKFSSQEFYNTRVYHVMNVVQMHKIGQLFIYDD